MEERKEDRSVRINVNVCMIITRKDLCMNKYTMLEAEQIETVTWRRVLYFVCSFEEIVFTTAINSPEMSH